MPKNKTQETQADVEAFLASIDDESKQKDCRAILKLMKSVTKLPPKMWGTSIVGFGNYHYKYASGREGDWFLTGFSPRKKEITLYIMPGFANYKPLMAQLGKYKTGVSCLYVKQLADIDTKVLESLVRESVDEMKNMSVSSR